MAKVKGTERILKAARETQSTRLSADHLTETLQARRYWHEVFQIIKSKNLQPRVLYIVKLSLKLKVI